MTQLSGFSGLLAAFVILGVLALVVQSPKSASQAFAAGPDIITGLYHGETGQK